MIASYGVRGRWILFGFGHHVEFQKGGERRLQHALEVDV